MSTNNSPLHFCDLYLMSVIAAVFFGAGHAGAKEVHLGMGETFRQGDLAVTCGQPSTDSPLSLKNCQYWDGFNKECLFETTRYSYKNIECLEDCQHWEAFNNTCHYETACTFYPSQMSFVRTSCEKFDDFNNTCLKTSEIKIGP
jgi:hypothetical protein